MDKFTKVTPRMTERASEQDKLRKRVENTIKFSLVLAIDLICMACRFGAWPDLRSEITDLGSQISSWFNLIDLLGRLRSLQSTSWLRRQQQQVTKINSAKTLRLRTTHKLSACLRQFV